MFGIKSKLSVACATLATAVVSSLIAFGACSPSDSNDSGSGGGNDPCGGACPVGSSCLQQASGAYQCQCQPGLQACGNSCVDLQSDAANCGTCGNVCGGDTPYCSLGACSATCAGGTTACGFSCVDTASNPYHCGGCGVACDGGLACSAGTCGCAAGANCGGGGDGDGDGDGGGDGEYGGYITSGTWKGYAWTHAQEGATIEPEDFSATSNFPLCVKGNVAPHPEYQSLAMLGWNINQGPEDADGMPVTPTLGGIRFNITNPSNAPLRIQIGGPNAETDPNDRWCAPIGTGGELFVPFDAFNTECWVGGEGNTYAGEPITNVSIVVPGEDVAAIPFDFCVQSLMEDNEEGGGGGGCSLAGGPTPGSAFSLSGMQRDRATADGRYGIQSNYWNNQAGGDQTIAVAGTSFKVASFSGTGDQAPASYPSLIVGSDGGDGFGTVGSNLPKQISQIQSVPTGLAWSNTGVNGKYNVAYDVWFGPSSGDAGPGSRKFLMVWLHDEGGPVPAGGPAQQGEITTGSVAGRTWEIWTGVQHEGRPIVSYRGSNIPSYEFDLKDFIDDAVSRNILTPSDYLTNIFAGFEIWSGGTNLEVTNFCAQVN